MRKAESIFSMVIAILCLIYLFFIWQMDDFGAVTEPERPSFPQCWESWGWLYH